MESTFSDSSRSNAQGRMGRDNGLPYALFHGMINAVQGAVAYCQCSRDDGNRLPTFTYTVVSDLFAGRLGLSSDRIVERTIEDIALGFDTNLLVRSCEEAYRLKKPVSFDFAHARVSGGVTWQKLTAQPLDQGVILSLRDITDQKQGELAIQTQTDALQVVQLNGVLLLQAIRNDQEEVVDFLMIAANRAVERSLFRSPDALIGNTLLSVFPGAVQSGFFDLYLRVIKSGHTEGAEYYYQDENGFTGWFDVVVSLQVPDQLVLIFTNTTALKETQLLHQRQINLLQKVLDYTQATISVHEPIYDESGVTVGFQATLHGRQTEDRLLRLWKAILDPTRSQFQEADSLTGDTFRRCANLIKNGHSDTFEYAFEGRIYAVNVINADNYLLLSTVDMTAEREHIRQLEAANRYLIQSNDDLQSFAFVASHDLQEPLRKIQQFSDLLNAQYSAQIGPEGVDLLHRMRKSADRMSILIQDLLSLSRISTQHQSMQQVDMRQLVGDVLEDLDMVVRDKQALVQLGELNPVWGDERQLRQLMQNLLTNALKFTAPGQKPVVDVDCRLVGADELPPKLRERGPCCCLKVADKGIGFDAKAYGERIFETFQRLHSRKEYEGTGIGLAVVRKVVERHRGEVLVESEPGRGAVFYLYLPIQQTQQLSFQ